MLEGQGYGADRLLPVRERGDHPRKGGAPSPAVRTDRASRDSWREAPRAPTAARAREAGPELVIRAPLRMGRAVDLRCADSINARHRRRARGRRLGLPCGSLLHRLPLNEHRSTRPLRSRLLVPTSRPIGSLLAGSLLAEPFFAEPFFAGPFFAGPFCAGLFCAGLFFGESFFAESFFAGPTSTGPPLAGLRFTGLLIARPLFAGFPVRTPNPSGPWRTALASRFQGWPERLHPALPATIGRSPSSTLRIFTRPQA